MSEEDKVVVATAAKKAPRSVKRHAHRKESWASYIYRVLKQVHPETGISRKSMAIMDSFVQDMFDRIMAEARKLATANHRSTLTVREIQTAVRLVLPKELALHAVGEGIKAYGKYVNTLEDKKPTKKVPKATPAEEESAPGDFI